jgi:hypothetical protein
MHGLAEVQLEMLTRTFPVMVKCYCCQRASHQWDSNARPKSMSSRKDWVLSRERDRPSGRKPRDADVQEQIVDGFDGIKVDRFGCDV